MVSDSMREEWGGGYLVGGGVSSGDWWGGGYLVHGVAIGT